jgi:SOS response regulatory protein OraA/RecX
MVGDIRKMREIDHAKPIVEYLRKNMAKGYKPQDLKWALINQGYSRMEVDKAIKMVSEFEALQRPKKIEEPKVEPIVEMPEVPAKKGFFKRLFG